MSNKEHEDDSVKVQLLQKQKPPVIIHRKNNTIAKQKSTEQSHSPTSDDVPLDECNIFVKYLPQDIDDDALRELFTKFGAIVSCKVMLDNRNNGASLGFGFVKFFSSSDARDAIKNMNGYQIHNKTLLCKLSNATPNSPPTPTTPSQTTSIPPSSNLYVKNLLARQREDELKELFEPFGQVLDVKVMLDKNTKESRQIGFVRFANQQQASAALNAMNGHLFEQSDVPLAVRYAESEGDKTTRKQRQNRPKPRHVEYVEEQYIQEQPFDTNTQPMEYFTQPFANTYVPQYDAYNNFYYQQQFYNYQANQLPLTFHSMSLNAQPVTPPKPRRKSTESLSSDASPPQVADAGANLFVFHLPSDVNDTQLYSLFSHFGTIESIKVITDGETGESKGYGFVKYYSMGDAIRAIEAMNGYQIGRKHLKVSFKTSGNILPPQAEKRGDDLTVTNQNFPALKQPVRVVAKKKKNLITKNNGPSSPNSSLTGGSTGNPIPILKKRDFIPNAQEKQN